MGQHTPICAFTSSGTQFKSEMFLCRSHVYVWEPSVAVMTLLLPTYWTWKPQLAEPVSSGGQGKLMKVGGGMPCPPPANSFPSVPRGRCGALATLRGSFYLPRDVWGLERLGQRHFTPVHITPLPGKPKSKPRGVLREAPQLWAQGKQRCARSVWHQMWPAVRLCTVEMGPTTYSELRYVFIRHYQKRQGGTR